jgi:hypothetical protein
LASNLKDLLLNLESEEVLSNEIAHDYENSEEVGREIVNSIFSHR